MMKLRKAALLSLVLIHVCGAASVRAKSWERKGELGPAPARVTEGLPLSDQGDEGH